MMTTTPRAERVSVIVPTIGRPDSLRLMLESLLAQTVKVHEVMVADGSSSGETAALVADERWRAAGLSIRRIVVHPPNAVRQRIAAIAAAEGEFLLMLDDDVVLEAGCVGHMIDALRADETTVAVITDFNNQTWPTPTRAWRFYLRHILGLADGAWQGRVVGPLLRFGYTPAPTAVMPMDWLSTGHTMVRRTAYERAGGFSDFFLHRCTMNEDVDLGLKLSKIGRIVFCPAARVGHFHAPGGRVSVGSAAEDDLYNRFLVMRHTQQRSAAASFGMVLLFFCVETASNVGGALLRLRTNGLGARTRGRASALARILFTRPTSTAGDRA